MPPGADSTDPRLAALGEFGLIDRLRRRVPTAGPGVIVGIGDDTAVLRFGGPVLATCDVAIEGVHFTREICGPADIGWRALAVNLSDIAAMGGVPRYALVSLAIPPACDLDTLDGIYDGMAELAVRHGVAVVGGNVARTAGPLVVDVTLLGEAAPHRAGGVSRGVPSGEAERRILTRRGAQPGDGVWITGAVGKAAAGLFLLRHAGARCPGLAPADREALASAYRRPVPRVDAGQALAETPGVHALIDTSDGTASDLLHLVEASGVGVRLDASALPAAPGVTETARAAAVETDAWALGGGEDYELLLAAAPAFGAAAKGFAGRLGLPLTRIGEILAPEEGRTITRRDGRHEPLAAKGWDHFGGTA